MSLWDKYFAPGDIRRQRQHQSPLQSPPPHQNEQTPIVIVKPPHSPPSPTCLSPSERSRRQNGLLYGGIGFTLLSMFVTRRALQRKYAQVQAQALAKAISPSAATSPSAASAAAIDATKTDGSLEAVQALGYATLNVFSMAMLGIGAAMTYFDVADLEDMRAGLREYAGYNGDEGESEREIEAWVAEVLSRRDARTEEAVVRERIAEIERERRRGSGG